MRTMSFRVRLTIYSLCAVVVSGTIGGTIGFLFGSQAAAMLLGMLVGVILGRMACELADQHDWNARVSKTYAELHGIFWERDQ